MCVCVRVDVCVRVCSCVCVYDGVAVIFMLLKHKPNSVLM